MHDRFLLITKRRITGRLEFTQACFFISSPADLPISGGKGVTTTSQGYAAPVRSAEYGRLAFRGLSRRPVRSLMTLLGLAISVVSMVLFLSLGQGLERQLQRELASLGPDLQVARETPGSALVPSPTLAPEVTRQIQVAAHALGITQVIPVAAQVKQSLDPTQSAVYLGVPANQGIEALFPNVSPSEGRLLASRDRTRAVVVLGAEAARHLHLGIGDLVPISRRLQARVIGILAPQGTLTDTFTFLPLEEVQRAFGAGRNLSFVALQLRHPEQAPVVAAQLRHQLHLEVSTRTQVFGAAAQILRSASAVSLGLSSVALVIGALTIINTLMMSLAERQREFGTFRAIGARPQMLQRLVLTEGVILSLLGGTGGTLLSLPGIWAINRLTHLMLGVDSAVLTPEVVAFVLGVSLVLGSLAGWWPARQAGKLTVSGALST